MPKTLVVDDDPATEAMFLEGLGQKDGGGGGDAGSGGGFELLFAATDEHALTCCAATRTSTSPSSLSIQKA